MVKWFHFNFQNVLNPDNFLFDWLHDYIIMFLIFILIFTGGVMSIIWKSHFMNKTLFEIPTLELFWTFSPGVILVAIGFPSILFLYNTEKNFFSDLSVKVTGHQWFWSYLYSDFEDLSFDSYLLNVDSQEIGGARLLDTDNHLVFPVSASTRLMVSSSDVLHSWTIPSMGMKADANPGRMNIIFLSWPISGLFYGQCSEICGANHSFMPICVEVSLFSLFKNWIKNF